MSIMRGAWLFVGALSICGQTLHLSAAAGRPGEKVTIEISLDSPAGKAPVALQWETIFPAQLMEVEGDASETGRAARDSGKSVTCAERKAYSYMCILAGGQKLIANGPIAVLHFRIRAKAPVGTSAVRIERAEGVTVDVKRLALQDAAATVTIQ